MLSGGGFRSGFEKMKFLRMEMDLKIELKMKIDLIFLIEGIFIGLRYNMISETY